jgi:hypothetical protein
MSPPEHPLTFQLCTNQFPTGFFVEIIQHKCPCTVILETWNTKDKYINQYEAQNQ